MMKMTGGSEALFMIRLEYWQVAFQRPKFSYPAMISCPIHVHQFSGTLLLVAKMAGFDRNPRFPRNNPCCFLRVIYIKAEAQISHFSLCLPSLARRCEENVYNLLHHLTRVVIFTKCTMTSLLENLHSQTPGKSKLKTVLLDSEEAT